MMYSISVSSDGDGDGESVVMWCGVMWCGVVWCGDAIVLHSEKGIVVFVCVCVLS